MSDNAVRHRQFRDGRGDARIDLKHAARLACVHRHARRRAHDGLRFAGVLQFELAERQVDRLRSGEDGGIEGDGCVSCGIEIREQDGFAQTQKARSGSDGIDCRIHDQAGKWRPGVGQIERSGRSRGCRVNLILAGYVIGRRSDARLPPVITAEAADKMAVAPLAAMLATKLTMPPSTGSIGLLAVTITASGLANSVPMSADCGVLPGTRVMVKPWLSKAPMSTCRSRGGVRRAGRWWFRPARERRCRRRPGCRATGASSLSGRHNCPVGPAAE